MFRDYGLMCGELRAKMEELQEKKDSIDIGVSKYNSKKTVVAK